MDMYSSTFTSYSFTFYYLPGTTGWDDFPLNTGVPIAPWLPAIQASGSDFHVQTNQFGFNINWASGTDGRGGSLHESCQSRLAVVANQHAHHRLSLFQRSAVDELSQPLLPPPLAVKQLRHAKHPRRDCVSQNGEGNGFDDSIHLPSLRPVNCVICISK